MQCTNVLLWTTVGRTTFRIDMAPPLSLETSERHTVTVTRVLENQTHDEDKK
jgi:hypothetical protein